MKGSWLRTVVLGHYRYYGVSRNGRKKGILQLLSEPVMVPSAPARRPKNSTHMGNE